MRIYKEKHGGRKIMEDNNLNNIQEALEKMNNVAKKIEGYYNLFESKPNDIFQQLKTKYILTDERDYKSFVEGLSVKRNELKIIYDDINTISINMRTLKLEETNPQFITFLIHEIVNYNWSQMSYLEDYNINNVTKFITKLDNKPITYSNEDHQAVDALNWIMLYSYREHLTLLQNKISSIKVFDKIKDIKTNIVMIGANGSGKSTFARTLKGKLSDNITIISAQHLLIFNKPETISINNKEIDLVHSFQSSEKLGSDPNLINLFSNDFNNLISALFAENGEREHNYYSDLEEKKDSILIKAINIWDKIIVHRNLKYSKYSIEVSTLDEVTYNFNFLSDGEKAVFYYISHVLLAKQNSYIIIDEPENHLHLAICNKLWDILEQERKDCKFIYLTHNLDFATTRTNRVLLWNKKFVPPSEWDVIKLPQDEIIPERLLMEIVGSRKNILFCEGDNKTSLDFKLYSILFPDQTIIPVGGHLNVINYCMAYNKNKQIYGQEAVGIIDGDCHLTEQINKWKSEKIYTLPINEIENLMCDELIISSAIKQFCSAADANERFKNRFFIELEKDKEYQSIWYTNNIINNRLKDNMLKEKRNLESLKLEFQEILNDDIVQKSYDARLKELEKLISNKDYESSLKICNFKGKLINYISKEIVSEYEDRILNLILSDGNLQKIIKKKYFSFLDI